MNPSQELYTELLVRLKNAYKDKVFDGLLPPEGTPYPFVFLGNTQEISNFSIKGTTFGRTQIVVHVWHNKPTKRGDLSSLMFDIERIGRSIDKTENFGWCMSSRKEEVMPDNTTNEPLMHGIVTLEFKNYRS